MPESLDQIRARRPMPLAKARADDTIVALAMNGEVLPADHGFPARMVVSGWLGAASIKWLARIEVSRGHLYVPWNTEDYVLVGPGYPSDGPARGPSITSLPISTLTELPWPARLRPERQMIRGRAFAGDVAVAAVEYRIDDGPWRPAELSCADIPGAWARWQFAWTPEPGRPRSCGSVPPTSGAAPSRTRRSGTSSATSSARCWRTPCTSRLRPRRAVRRSPGEAARIASGL